MQRGTRRVVAVMATALIALFLTACLPSRTYTYRIESRGPVAADLGQFAAHVASTLSDPRGWSLGGPLRFEQVAGPSDFTIVLAAAGTMPSFGPPCSPEWSCQSGRNVIINETRWRTATPSWPYDLDSYQHYVVNHEVGHWLGFGHTGCGGFGQRAPVMAQQSKGAAGGLGSCRFNVWPLPGERNQAGAVHRVAPAPPDLPTPDDPFGALDGIAVTRNEQGDPVSVSAAGWALDGDTAGSLTVLLVVDGRLVSQAVADRPRPDVAAGYPRFGAARGYEVGADIPTTSVEACVVALGAGAGLPFQQLGCRTVK